MPDAIKQHVVPQIYLRQFANSRKELYVVRRQLPGDIIVPPRTLQVRRAAVFDDFYTVTRDDGTRDQSLEDQLAVFENRYYPLFKSLRKPDPLAGSVLAEIKFLATLQYSRSLVIRDMMVIRNALIGTDGTEAADLLLAMTPSIEELKRHLALSSDAAGSLKRADDFARMQSPLIYQAFAELFTDLYICVLKSDVHDFFTNDQPVVVFHPTMTTANVWDDFPYHRPTLEITFPLTKRHCALFTWLPMPAQAKASADVVTTINARTAFCAAREVFTAPHAAVAERSRFFSNVRADDKVRRQPLLWSYFDRSSTGTLLTAIGKHEYLAPAARIKTPLWWWLGFPDQSPELQEALKSLVGTSLKTEAIAPLE